MSYIDREILMQQTVSAVIEHANTAIWLGDLTAAEARVVWLQVVLAMLKSVEIDQSTAVVSEHMGLGKGREL